MPRFAMLSFAAAIAMAGPALAAPGDGPCSAANTAGVWELVSIRADEPGVQGFYAEYPVEYMRFGAGGAYIYVARQQPLKSMAEIKASLDRADAGDGLSYRAEFARDGTMIIHRNGQPFQGFRCSIKGGQMIWTEYPGNLPLRRVQRRVK